MTITPEWLPRSFECLRHYDRQTFISDLIAGITVGLVAVPLAMAFAISSGLPPQAGLYCAVVTGFLISLLGGSKTQIGGPTGAFVVVVSGIVAKHEDLAEQLKHTGRTMILCGAREQPAAQIRRVNFAGKIGAENICLTVDDALARAAELHSRKIA